MGGCAGVAGYGLFDGAGIKHRTGVTEPLSFPDQSFDLVISVGELPFWRDKAEVFREVHRVLRPGGHALLRGRYQGPAV